MKEEMKSGHERMKKVQDELKKKMEKDQNDLKNSVEEKITKGEEKTAGRMNEKNWRSTSVDQKGLDRIQINEVEENLQNEVICVKQEMEEKMGKNGEVEENFSIISLKLQKLEKKLESTCTNPND